MAESQGVFLVGDVYFFFFFKVGLSSFRVGQGKKVSFPSVVKKERRKLFQKIVVVFYQRITEDSI